METVRIDRACDRSTMPTMCYISTFVRTLKLTMPRMLCNGNGAISHLQTEMGFVERLLLQLAQLIKVHFLPNLESFMWERKFEKSFFKKSPLQPPNGALLIFKLPFLNGSYRNGVCKALWAMLKHGQNTCG